MWAIEGAGGYGAGLARWLASHGELVTEVERPRRPARRHGAKSDPIDALRAAREALAAPYPTAPKQGAVRAALAARLTARRSAVDAAATAQRQLHALAVTCPASLHQRLAKLGTRQLIDRCHRLRVHACHDAETAETIEVLRRLARRIRDLEAEACEHETALRRLIASWRPDLLAQTGIGPIVGATLLCAWSHPGRVRSEAAFARLAGVAPRARPTARSAAASSATSPASSTANSKPEPPSHPLDRHRSVTPAEHGITSPAACTEFGIWCDEGTGPPLRLTVRVLDTRGCQPLTVLRREEAPMVSGYDGKQFVGIDLHCRRSVIVRQDADGEVLEQVRIDNDAMALACEIEKAGAGTCQAG